MPDGLFVITVASEKGGVGKTTLATNLAVYLKALREELPVTIASFDNHFSVDNMFAIGAGRAPSVARLFTGEPLEELARLGEYGVQYLGSERALQAPDQPDDWLAGHLGRGGLEGVLILDTRPILDYFTRSALQCADLVLIPVKDRASLVNADALQRQLTARADGTGRCWLVPSLIDGRLRLKDGVGMREYLAFLGAERGLQVYDGYIAKSPKVESLASGFSSRIPPVITHARGTLVHQQLRQLAEFALQRQAAAETTVSARVRAGRLLAGAAPGARRRLLAECPVCGRQANGAAGELFLHLRSRRRGFLHPECLRQLLAGSDLQAMLEVPGMLALEIEGGGESGGPGRYRLHLFDGAGEPVLEERLGSRSLERFREFVGRATGCGEELLLRELVLLTLCGEAPAGLLGGVGQQSLSRLRRQVLKHFAAAR